MEKFVPGQIVLRRWTNAKLLKNKVVKIVGVVPPVHHYDTSSKKYRVVSPTGRQMEISEYRLESFEDRLVNLEVILLTLECQVSTRKEDIYQTKKEIEKAKSLFPTV